MRRWDQRVLRLLRALLACTVLLFAAQGPVVVADPVRDVSAWVAVSRGRVAPAARTQSRVTLAQRRQTPAPMGSVQPAPAPAARVLLAALSTPDGRYTYLDLQTLRC